jgi:chemotaxis protein methyltransferase CheR
MAPDTNTTFEASITDREFHAVQRFLFDASGISLSDAKKLLVSTRLGKRLRACALKDYSAYLKLIAEDAQERQFALDLLTTNETYFFREPQHFDFLRTEVVPRHPPGRTFRVWSAACSSGEEPYSIAMQLDSDLATTPWEVVGTDISTRMLDKCRAGRYPMERAQGISKEYLRRYCLMGTGPEQGYLLVDRPLRGNLNFRHANLNGRLPDVGEFDVIFLRNVMIYFDADTKRSLIGRILTHLRPGGWLFIGHSESLHGINASLKPVRPAIYQKP